MRLLPPPPDDGLDERTEIGARVADQLAQALVQGSRAALVTARGLSEQELRLGLDFVVTVLDVAASSARALTAVLVERGERGQGWH
jgi:hypothetical protein